MKILAWNIRQGGGRRIQQIIKSILAYQADVIIISEFHNTAPGDLMRSKLLEAGYLFQKTSIEERKNTVLIASKIEGEFLTYYDQIELFPQSIISLEFESFKIYGVYLPHKKKHKLFEFLLEEIDIEKPCIIMGDFNSGINFLDQKGSSFWYADNFPKLLKKSYVDAYRVIHDARLEFSWFSHQGNGFRYDHCWLHSSLVNDIEDCYFSHAEREAKESDHSLMVLELK